MAWNGKEGSRGSAHTKRLRCATPQQDGANPPPSNPPSRPASHDAPTAKEADIQYTMSTFPCPPPLPLSILPPLYTPPSGDGGGTNDLAAASRQARNPSQRCTMGGRRRRRVEGGGIASVNGSQRAAAAAPVTDIVGDGQRGPSSPPTKRQSRTSVWSMPQDGALRTGGCDRFVPLAPFDQSRNHSLDDADKLAFAPSARHYPPNPPPSLRRASRSGKSGGRDRLYGRPMYHGDQD